MLQPMKTLILQTMLTERIVSGCKDTVVELCSRVHYLNMSEEKSQILIQDLELWLSIRDWIKKRKATVHSLRVYADELMEHHKNVCVANVAGSSVSIAGSAAVATGFALSFVTFGASLVLSGAGTVIAAAGGLVNLGSSVAEAFLQKTTLDIVQKIIEEDREAKKALDKLLEKAKKQNTIVVNGIQMGWKGATILGTCVKTGYKIGVRVGAQAASEGGEALFRSLKMSGRVIHVGGFAVSAALLPLDIYTLVKNAMEIDAVNKGKKGTEPEVVKELRKIADELEEELPFINEDNFA